MKNSFIPPLVTSLILTVNLAFWGAMELLGDSDDLVTLLRFGANFDVFTLGGEPWRLITSMFVHIGPLHLIFNLYALYYLGRFLEEAIGAHMFWALYVISGLVGSLTSSLFYDGHVSAGASGAVMGILGASIAMLVVFKGRLAEPWRQRFLWNFLIIAGLNVAIGFFETRIDMAAHVGGLVAGLGLCLALSALPVSPRRVAVYILSAAATALVLISAVLVGRGLAHEGLVWQGPLRTVSLAPLSLEVPAYWQEEASSPSHVLLRDGLGLELALVSDTLDEGLAETEVMAALNRSLIKGKSCTLVERGATPLGLVPPEGFQAQAMSCHEEGRRYLQLTFYREERGTLMVLVLRVQGEDLTCCGDMVQGLLATVRVGGR